MFEYSGIYFVLYLSHFLHTNRREKDEFDQNELLSSFAMKKWKIIA